MDIYIMLLALRFVIFVYIDLMLNK